MRYDSHVLVTEQGLAFLSGQMYCNLYCARKSEPYVAEVLPCHQRTRGKSPGTNTGTIGVYAHLKLTWNPATGLNMGFHVSFWEGNLFNIPYEP